MYWQEHFLDGIDPDCFGLSGLPIHDSWQNSRLIDWLRPEREEWQSISKAPIVNIRYPGTNSYPGNIRIMQERIHKELENNPTLRKHPVKWVVDNAPINPTRITRAMGLLWDGVRRWPYDSEEISEALATVIEYCVLVAQNPYALTYPDRAEILAEQCLGKVVEIEIEIEDGAWTRGYANSEFLKEAVRNDFSVFLRNQYREEITNIHHVLQIAFNPRRVFVFDRLKLVFCTQIVPTQVAIRGEDPIKALLYNPTRMKRLGLP